MSQTEKEWALPAAWSCLKTGWDSFRCGSNTLSMREIISVYSLWCTKLLVSVCVRGQESFWMCVSICTCFLPFAAVVYTLLSTSSIPVYAISLLVFIGYEFEGSLNTSRSLSVGFGCLNLLRLLQLLSVSQTVQYLNFILLSPLDLIRYRVQGYEVWVRSTRTAFQECSYFQPMMYDLSAGKNQMHSTTFCW